MHWNYRILAKRVENDVEFGLYEVHYADDDTIEGCTTNQMSPITFSSYSDDPIKSLKWVLDAMKLACEKPILDYDNFPKVYQKYYRKKKLRNLEKYL
jgi:hypothetical protein